MFPGIKSCFGTRLKKYWYVLHVVLSRKTTKHIFSGRVVLPTTTTTERRERREKANASTLKRIQAKGKRFLPVSSSPPFLYDPSFWNYSKRQRTRQQQQQQQQQRRQIRKQEKTESRRKKKDNNLLFHFFLFLIPCELEARKYQFFSNPGRSCMCVILVFGVRLFQDSECRRSRREHRGVWFDLI